MFDAARPDLSRFDAVLQQLQAYVDRLFELADDGRFGDTFGLDATNWAQLGKKAGRHGQATEPVQATIEQYFDSGLANATLLLSQTRTAAGTWEKKIHALRQAEIEFLETEVERCAEEADPQEAGSEAAKAHAQLVDLEHQLDIASQLSRLWSGEDVDKAAALKTQASRVVFSDRLTASRQAWAERLISDYQSRSSLILQRLEELTKQMATPAGAAEDAASQADRESEINRLKSSLNESPEQEAIEGMDRLIRAATALPMGGTTVAGATGTPPQSTAVRPPKWWRSRSRAYRQVLWAIFGIAFLGEELVMQYMTGGMLGVRMLPRVLAEMSEKLSAIGAVDGFFAFLAQLPLLAEDIVGVILALVFGAIPLLLSLPLRYHLDRCDERGDDPIVFFKFFAFAIALLFATLAVVAFTSGNQQFTGLAGYARGMALPSISLVLILGAALASHLLFTESSHRDYHEFLRQTEIGRIKGSITEVRGRITQLERATTTAQEALLRAQQHHAGEDSLAAAIADREKILDNVFDKAKAAAKAAFLAGYGLGEQVRTLGKEYSTDEPDARSFEELLDHLTKRRLIEITTE